MKIGILTFHRAYNYGAVLQAYALKTVLNDLGVDAEIVDYVCQQVDLDHHPKYTLKKLGFPKALIGFYGRFVKSFAFEKFKKEKLCTGSEYTKKTIKKVSDVYDLFIVGSDQIWSNKFSGFDTTFLLDFVDDKTKKYSYAASFGFSQFPEKTKNIYKKYLREFMNISVREQSAVDMLKNECNLDASVNLDPTLILGADKWKHFCKKPDINKKYILIYTIQPPVNLIKYAKRLSKETGYELLYLSNSYKQYREIKHIRLVSPEEYVGWFANAEYVLTNSFHGTAFSLIFNRNLVVETKTQQSINTRSRDMLNLCGLDNRILDGDYRKFKLGEINWSEVNSRIEEQKEQSVSYLRGICKKGK